MTEAFICDAIRTPIGRYGGSLSSVRADDLAAIPIRALIDRNPSVDWDALDDVIYGCANQAGEDNRNLARMAGPARRASRQIRRRDAQPPLRLRHGRGGDGGAGDPRLGGGHDRRRRLGEHEPRALRHGQGDQRVRSQCRDLRHDDRLALRQPEDEVALMATTRCRARPRMSRRISRFRREDQDLFAVRSQAKAAAAQASGRFDAEIVPVEIPQRKGDPIIVDARRASARDQRRGAGQAEADRPPRRHRHRRQRLRRQ